MTPKEFIEYVYSAREPRVAEYILGKIDDSSFHLLERLSKLDSFTEQQLSTLKRVIRRLPPEIAFHYCRGFYLNEQMRPIIDDSKVLLFKIATLRGFNANQKWYRKNLFYVYLDQAWTDLKRRFVK